MDNVGSSLLRVGPDYITQLLLSDSGAGAGSGANQSGKRRRKRGEKSPAASTAVHNNSSSSSSSSNSNGRHGYGTAAGDDSATCRAVKCAADPYAAVVFLRSGEACAVSGACSLTLLKGTRVSINGYALAMGVSVDVVAPPWQPAAALQHDGDDEGEGDADTAAKRSKKTFTASARSLLETVLGSQAGRAFAEAAETAGWWTAAAAAVLVRGAPPADQEWLIAAEDQGAYQQLLIAAASADASGGATDLHTWGLAGVDRVVSVGSAVAGGPQAVALLVGNDVLALPPGWAEGVGRVTTDSRRAAASLRGTRAVVCGAKGVGKSTCLRYAVNRLLSPPPSPPPPSQSSSSSSSSSPPRRAASTSAAPREVAVIDCDLGQPEFNLPGTLALHVVAAPVLSPPHLRLLHPPEVAYFVGDLTTKHEPEAFAAALDLLMRRYQECREARIAHRRAEVQRRRAERAKQAERLTTHANPFAALDTDVNTADADDEADGVDGGDPLPLVVNTDGAVRFMGAEVLTAVMGIVQPTHVLHISTEKDRDLPAIAMLRAQGATDAGTCTGGGGGVVGSAGNGDRRKRVKTDGNVGPAPGLGGAGAGAAAATAAATDDDAPCVVYTLEPGRLRPSKVAATDLRTLRFVAYFLRHSAALAAEHRARWGAATTDGGSPAGTGAAGVGLYIRTGAVVDPRGYLATALLRVPPLVAALSEVVLRVHAAEMPARLALAAVNASLVGILLAPAVPAGGEGSGSAGLLPLGVRRVDLLLPAAGEGGGGGGGGAEGGCSILFDEAHSGGGVSAAGLAPCVGMGIVRCVDVARNLLYLVTPVPPAALRDASCHVVLVRSGLQLPPALLYCPDGQPAHPHMSGEVTGEGAAAMKARTNVKRRSQHR